MGFMTPPDVDDPKLAAFRARGGKLIAYHGNSDAVFSVNDTQRWFGKLQANAGGDAGGFARLYTVPGMAHCSGGPAADQADFITPLVNWVEYGQAPASIVATARGPGNPGGVNADVPADWAPNRSRPLCPFPGVAKYKGSGDVELASSWACRDE